MSTPPQAPTLRRGVVKHVSKLVF